MSRATDLSGQTFGRLTIVGRAGTANGRNLWRAKCACGKWAAVTTTSLRSNRPTRSCGCLRGVRRSSPVVDGFKDCRVCKRTLYVTEFYADQAMADGIKHECRQCSIAAVRCRRQRQRAAA